MINSLGISIFSNNSIPLEKSPILKLIWASEVKITLVPCSLQRRATFSQLTSLPILDEPD